MSSQLSLPQPSPDELMKAYHSYTKRRQYQKGYYDKLKSSKDLVADKDRTILDLQQKVNYAQPYLDFLNWFNQSQPQLFAQLNSQYQLSKQQSSSFPPISNVHL